MDYIQVSAKTVEDAVLEAAMKLATTRDHLEYEVIEKGSAGFLGFGARNAVIKARALTDEEKAAAKRALNQENIKKATAFYNENAKPGSLASKANMVRKFEEKNTKK